MTRAQLTAVMILASAAAGCSGTDGSTDTPTASPGGTPSASPEPQPTMSATPPALSPSPTGLPPGTWPQATPTPPDITPQTTHPPTAPPTDSEHTPPPVGDTPTQGDTTPTPADTTEAQSTPTAPLGVLEDCDEQRSFFAWDLAVMPPATIEITATCRLMGPNAYLYVADDQWPANVDADLARRFMEAMELYTPQGSRDPGQGIIANNIDVFGEIPDAIDADPRMYFLLMDLADFTSSSSGLTYSFDGYFNAYDQLPDAQVERLTRGLYRSNEVEMLYINSRLRPADAPYTLAVAAHEMQHLIHWGFDTAEDIWLSEALAEIAMLINGYYTDEPWVQSYASDPAAPLVTNTSAGSYGAFLLWGMYLYEQLGEAFIVELQAQQSDGIDGIDRTLRAGRYGTDFVTLFSDWAVANAVDDRREGPSRFSYQFTEVLPEMSRVEELSLSGEAWEGSLLAFGVDYLDIFPDEAMGLEIEGDVDGMMARLVIYEPSGALQILNLEPTDDGPEAELAPENSYLLVVSYLDEAQVDTGLMLNYAVSLE